MPRLIYFVSASLDGFIAGPDGEYDFLPFDGDLAGLICAEYPETLPAPAREALGLRDAPNQRFGAVVMGRNTYQVGLDAGLTNPYPHLRQYVVSRSLSDVDPAVSLERGDPVALVTRLKAEAGGDIWLAGGGRLAAALRDEIDELVIKRHPVVVGNGVPMFAGRFAPGRYTVTESRTFADGASLTSYAR